MIYLFDDLRAFDECEIDRMMQLLPENRRKKCGRYLRLKDRRLCVVAYLLLMYGFIREGFEQYCLLDFDIGEDGKPYLKENMQLNFNLSHCDRGVLCGISRKELGLDIQDFDIKMNREEMNIVLSEAELSAVIKADNPQKQFVRFWTLKESYYKCIGTGLVDEIRQLDFSKYDGERFWVDKHGFYIKEFEQFYIAVCREGIAQTPQIEYITLQELRRVLASVLYYEKGIWDEKN